MDSLVSGARKLPAGSADEFEKFVKKIEGNMKALRKSSIGQVEQALNELNPTQHTYAYALALSLKSDLEFKDHNVFVEQCRNLFMNMDEKQLKHAQKYVATCSRKLIQSLQLTGKWMLMVQPLKIAVLKLRTANGNDHLLTPVHSDFMCVALKAKAYSVAMDIVDTPVFDIEPKETGLEPLDLLTYFYYSGMVCIGLKKFDRALEQLQQVLTAPTMTISAVQVEAYKKFVLCSLIATGQTAKLPEKLTSPVVNRSIERLCQPYIDFSKAFRKGLDEINKVVDMHLETYKKDKNWGLVRQAVQASIRANILRLTNTYVTVSLAELARQANLSSAEEAERHLLAMIESGQLHAVINKKDGMISFLEDPEEYDNSEVAALLNRKINEVESLGKLVAARDRELQLNPVYLTRMYGIGEKGKEREHRAAIDLEEMEEEMMAKAIQESLRG